MTGRQHAYPVLISPDGVTAALQPLASGTVQISEDRIQDIVFRHPECLPINEIDPLFSNAIPVCRELNTRAGAIDNFMITPSGLPVIVECKLWRNPEGRREVIGQIIDYAKELSRWTCSDLQRETNRRLKTSGNALLDLVRIQHPDTDEVAFNDALSLNLRMGRFLLLIVGDGIREGVEAIAEYVQRHAGQHFTLGLVELPVFTCADGSLLVAPRVVARTHLITRTVIAIPEGHMVVEDEIDTTEQVDPMTADRLAFWTDFVAGLTFSDPDQPVPKPSKQGYISIMLPAPSGSSWILAFRDVTKGQVGIYVNATRNSVADAAMLTILQDWDGLRTELGGDPKLEILKDGRQYVIERKNVGPLTVAANRKAAIDWLQARSNDFVNVFRPRIRAEIAKEKGA